MLWRDSRCSGCSVFFIGISRFTKPIRKRCKYKGYLSHSARDERTQQEHTSAIPIELPKSTLDFIDLNAERMESR